VPSARGARQPAAAPPGLSCPRQSRRPSSKCEPIAESGERHFTSHRVSLCELCAFLQLITTSPPLPVMGRPRHVPPYTTPRPKKSARLAKASHSRFPAMPPMPASLPPMKKNECGACVRGTVRARRAR
jgi:hypothetical protein